MEREKPATASQPEILSIQREGYAACLVIARVGGVWCVYFRWDVDLGPQGEGQCGPMMADRAQAICAGVRVLLASLDAADPLRMNPQVNGVERRRMERIREWAQELAEKHRPVAVPLDLFGAVH